MKNQIEKNMEDELEPECIVTDITGRILVSLMSVGLRSCCKQRSLAQWVSRRILEQGRKKSKSGLMNM